MKKLLYISTFLVSLLMLIPSCVREEDDIFDKPSAERLNTAIAEYKKVLVAAPDGWLMEYYAGKSTSRNGGFNLLCKFTEDGKVTVASELEAGEEETSLFDVISEQAVILSFSTYNSLMHHFSEPKGGPNSLFGDFEFVFTEVTDSRIVMKGKKQGSKIVMTRYSRTETWQEYLDEVLAMIESTSIFSTFKVYVNGTEMGTSAVDDNRSYEFVLGTNSYSQNAIYTPTGIKFYEPVTIDGKEVENFDWDEASMTYTCTDNVGAAITMVAYVDPSYLFYDEFIGTYKLKYRTPTMSSGEVEVDASIEVLVKDKTFMVKGFGPWELVAQYNKASGTITILSQIVGTTSTHNITFCSMDDKAGYLSRTTTIGMNSARDVDYSGVKFGFKDNGVWLTYVVNSYIVWLYTDAGVSGGQYTAAGTNRFCLPEMTKQ